MIENLAVVYPSARIIHNHAQRPRLSGQNIDLSQEFVSTLCILYLRKNVTGWKGGNTYNIYSLLSPK